jgi:hypothetical protein
VAAIIATGGLALLAAAGCGGSNTGGSTNSQSAIAKALAFSHCMRSQDVSKFPDPNGSGAIPKVSLQQLGVGSSQFQRAQKACQQLLPNSGQSSQAQVQQVMNALSKFARCVRSHGVPNWPDPLRESDAGEPGTPGFPRDMPGINQNSPLVKNAMGTCQHLLAGIGYGSGGYP